MMFSKWLVEFSEFQASSLELDFVPTVTVIFASDNWPLVIGIVILYLAFISIGTFVMANRKAFDMRLLLAAWNAFLCIFSFIGMYRTMPYLISMLISQSYNETVCTDPSLPTSWGVGPSGFWVMLFIFSKIPELIDTVFIVLRKRQLIFLHWYHHVTVLLFCWSSYSTKAGSGLYFVAMNYSVHTLMYGYYCMHALRICPRSFPAVLITASQILQMLVGTGVCISCWYYKLTGHACYNDTSNLIAGALMYGSYLYLFMEFAFGRYWYIKPKATKMV